MKTILSSRTLLVIFIISVFFQYNLTAKDNQPAFDIVRAMGRGINLGNTLEPKDEGNWTKGVPAKEYYFDDYMAAGFTCVRIPVRWGTHMESGPSYKIDKSWMDRIEEVVDWALSRGFYVVLNSHHDLWIKHNPTEAEYKQFDKMWEQISDTFKDRSEKLIFEIINEPYHGKSTLTDE
jgi:endoglucanase